MKTLKLISFFFLALLTFFGTPKIVQNNGKIAYLEFESQGFPENHVFLPTEQAGANICLIVYQDINFKICRSLFGWKENIMYKQQIVQRLEWLN